MKNEKTGCVDEKGRGETKENQEGAGDFFRITLVVLEESPAFDRAVEVEVVKVEVTDAEALTAGFDKDAGVSLDNEGEGEGEEVAKGLSHNELKKTSREESARRGSTVAVSGLALTVFWL